MTSLYTLSLISSRNIQYIHPLRPSPLVTSTPLLSLFSKPLHFSYTSPSLSPVTVSPVIYSPSVSVSPLPQQHLLQPFLSPPLRTNTLSFPNQLLILFFFLSQHHLLPYLVTLSSYLFSVCAICITLHVFPYSLFPLL